MSSFRELLVRAQAGDKAAMERLLLLYDRMIRSASRVNGVFDEDLYQFLLLSVIQKIRLFRVP